MSEMLLFYVQIALAVFYHVSPAHAPQRIFFGVTVAPDFRNSRKARDLILLYRTAVWIAFVLSYELALRVMVMSPRTAFGAVLLQAVLSSVAFVAVNRVVRKDAVDAPQIRSADLLARRVTLSTLMLMGPALIAVGGAVVAVFGLGQHGSLLPSFPDLAIRASRLRHLSDTKSFSGIFGLFCGGYAGLLIIRFSARVNTVRIAYALPLAAGVTYAFACLLGVMLVATAAGWPVPQNTPKTVLIIVGVIAIIHFRLAARAKARSSEVSDGTADANWIGGLIYRNPNDPALLVPRRFGPGFTLNFGNWMAWVVTAALVVMCTVTLWR